MLGSSTTIIILEAFITNARVSEPDTSGAAPEYFTSIRRIRLHQERVLLTGCPLVRRGIGR